uniref:Uncharacterized protein n=1 Tax=Anguilla anguilla TaxID=7936 RepID=A0A0E9XL68_ANGAN
MHVRLPLNWPTRYFPQAGIYKTYFRSTVWRVRRKSRQSSDL